MICPQCRSEYRENVMVCVDCGLPLVAAMPEPTAFLEPLHETWNPDELAALLAGLEEAGVPYVVTAGTGLSLLDGSALRGAGVPDPWRARVLVLNSLHNRAREVLKGIGEDKLIEPWYKKPERTGG